MCGEQSSSQPRAGLRGSPPSLPFYQRVLLRGRPSAAALDLLALTTSCGLALLRGRATDGAADAPASQIALAAYACFAAASLAAYCLAGRHPSSAALKLQQALAVVQRLGWIALCEGALGLIAVAGRSGAVAGSGTSGELHAADGWVAWMAALLHHMLQLLASSSALCMLLQGLRRIPISLNIPMHLLMLAASSRRTAATCAAGALASPSAQRLTHQLYTWLRPLAFCAPLPLSLLSQQDAGGECHAMLHFLQAFLGTAVPLAWQAVAESRLFALHHAQRAAAGLAPERGLNAAILTAVHELMHEVVRPYLLIFVVFLTGSLWDWSCLLSAPEAVDGRGL